jgi:hypothetical protein
VPEPRGVGALSVAGAAAERAGEIAEKTLPPSSIA